MADQVPMARDLASAGTAASDPGGDQRGHAGRQAAEQGADDECGQPRDEELPAADPVGPAPGRHEHRREDDRVAVENPGQRAQAGARVLPADVGEGQVDDEAVKAAHEYGQGQNGDDSRQPAGAEGGAVRRRRGRRGAEAHGASPWS